MKGLCHGCLATIAYNTSFFPEELDVEMNFLVNDKITAMHQTSISPKHYRYKRYKQQK